MLDKGWNACRAAESCRTVAAVAIDEQHGRAPTDDLEVRIGRAIAGLDALRRQVPEQRLAQVQRPEAQHIQACQPLVTRVAPEYEILYRIPFELVRLLQVPPASPPASSTPAPSFGLACVPVRAGLLSIAADLRFRQIWALQSLGIGDLSSSIALAPAEELTLTIRKTQRTQLTEATVKSTETLDSFESGRVDKDVLNVARSTSQSQQWRVDANSSFSLGGVFSLGASGGLSGAVQSTSNTTVENITEATQKSAHRLQTLQKIEVARQSELTIEDTHKRVVKNPYRDRALTLNVYELNKRFSVMTALAEIRPVLVLEVTDLEFSRDFVLSHGDFLDDELLDRTLVAELRDALVAARTPVSSTHRDLARRYARMAFHVLFEATNVFNLDGGSSAENEPWQSFADNDAFEDANAYSMGRVFTTLGVYYHLQQRLYGLLTGVIGPQSWPVGPTDPGHAQEVDLAIALADSIRTDWTTVPAEKVKDFIDVGEKAEVMRRVAGFLSIVDSLLKPQVKPLEEEAGAAEASRRAEDVIQRVVSHLGCNKAHYVERYLDSLSRKTRGYALGDLLVQMLNTPQVSSLLTQVFGPMPNQNPVELLLQIFNPRAGFLDGFQFIVPLHTAINTTTAEHFIRDITNTPSPWVGPNFSGTFSSQTVDVVIPADGFHLEPIAGVCVLADVPDTTSTVRTSIQVDANGS